MSGSPAVPARLRPLVRDDAHYARYLRASLGRGRGLARHHPTSRVVRLAVRALLREGPASDRLVPLLLALTPAVPCRRCGAMFLPSRAMAHCGDACRRAEQWARTRRRRAKGVACATAPASASPSAPPGPAGPRPRPPNTP